MVLEFDKIHTEQGVAPGTSLQLYAGGAGERRKKKAGQHSECCPNSMRDD